MIRLRENSLPSGAPLVNFPMADDLNQIYTQALLFLPTDIQPFTDYVKFKRSQTASLIQEESFFVETGDPENQLYPSISKIHSSTHTNISLNSAKISVR